MEKNVASDGKLDHLYEVGVFNYDPEKYEWTYFGHLASHDYVYGFIKLREAWTEDFDAVIVKFYQHGVSDILSYIMHQDDIDDDLLDEVLSDIRVGAGTPMEVLTDMDVFIVDHDFVELCYGDSHGAWMVSLGFKNGISFARPISLPVV